METHKKTKRGTCIEMNREIIWEINREINRQINREINRETKRDIYIYVLENKETNMETNRTKIRE